MTEAPGLAARGAGIERWSNPAGRRSVGEPPALRHGSDWIVVTRRCRVCRT